MMRPKQRELVDLVAAIASEYPELPDSYAGDFSDPKSDVFVKRTAFDVGLVLERVDRASPTVIDIGGGLGLFSAAVSQLGARSILIDDELLWQDPARSHYFPGIRRVLDRHGVELVIRDVIEDGLGDTPVADAITNFHFMEHVHVSPKPLFHQAMDRLSAEGIFVIGVPNCANLRKRIVAPFGRTSWSPIEEWYEETVFRGHVREPSIHDLRYIARDLGLAETRIYGRNFLGLAARQPVRRLAARAADVVLRARPALCSDLYLVGRKPLGPRTPAGAGTATSR